MTLPPADPPAAPGVTKEVEEAISLYRLAVCNDLQNITHERVAARAVLLAAIEKYGDECHEQGYAECHQQWTLHVENKR